MLFLSVTYAYFIDLNYQLLWTIRTTPLHNSLFHALPAHPPFSLAKHFKRPWCHLKTSRRIPTPPQLHLTCQTIYALCITRTGTLHKHKPTLLECFHTPLQLTDIRGSFLKSVGFFLSDVLRGLHPYSSEPAVLRSSQNTFRPLHLASFLSVHDHHRAADWFMIVALFTIIY